MKLKTAINNAMKVQYAIKKCNGLIGTLGTEYECVKIKKAFIFGSTVKLKPEPNDLDVIVEFSFCGRRFGVTRIHNNKDGYPYIGAKIDKNWKRRFNYKFPADSYNAALRYMAGGMKMIRIHNWEFDERFADPKIMIYPRDDLSKWVESLT